MDSMRSKFKQRKGFVIGFRDIAFYTNDDCTRYVHLLLFVAILDFVSACTLVAPIVTFVGSI